MVCSIAFFVYMVGVLWCAAAAVGDSFPPTIERAINACAAREAPAGWVCVEYVRAQCVAFVCVCCVLCQACFVKRAVCVFVRVVSRDSRIRVAIQRGDLFRF